MKFLIIYFQVQISFFGTVLGHFNQCNFKIFCRWPTMAINIFTQVHLPNHKKASYGLVIYSLPIHLLHEQHDVEILK